MATSPPRPPPKESTYVPPSPTGVRMLPRRRTDVVLGPRELLMCVILRPDRRREVHYFESYAKAIQWLLDQKLLAASIGTDTAVVPQQRIEACVSVPGKDQYAHCMWRIVSADTPEPRPKSYVEESGLVKHHDGGAPMKAAKAAAKKAATDRAAEEEAVKKRAAKAARAAAARASEEREVVTPLTPPGSSSPSASPERATAMASPEAAPPPQQPVPAPAAAPAAPVNLAGLEAVVRAARNIGVPEVQIRVGASGEVQYYVSTRAEEAASQAKRG
jgi:hypothetical protein